MTDQKPRLDRQLGSAVAVTGIPDRIELMPVGPFRMADARGAFTLADPQAVIAASFEAAPGRELLIDFGHGVQGKAERRSDAAGWITGMEVEGDRVMASVTWTPAGRAAIEQKAYRFISPVFFNRPSDRQVVLIGGAGLVNDPGLPQLAQLASKQETPMDDLKKIAAALGLGEDATIDDILSAIAKATKPDVTPDPVLASVLKAAGVDALTDDTAKQICARLQEAPDPSVYVQKAAFDDVTRQLASLQKQVGDDAVEKAVSAAKAAGKVSPAMETWARQYAAKDIDGFQAFVDGAPVIVTAGRVLSAAPVTGADGLTEAERQMCSATGVDPATFLAEKKKEAV